MGELAFDRDNVDVGAKALDAKLFECRNPTWPDYVGCREATEQFLNQVLALPIAEQRRHLERAQSVNNETVRKSYQMPQLNIVFSKSTENLSDVKLLVPELHRVMTYDMFDP